MASRKDLVTEINSGKRSKEKNFGPLARFFETKTVLINNKFLAEFQDEVTEEKQLVYDRIGYMPRLFHHHIKSVNTPTNYNWGAETVARKGIDEDDMEEGNAFTAKLAATPKGGEFELDGKKYKDTSALEENEWTFENFENQLNSFINEDKEAVAVE